jgi:hypothetical protein
MSRFLIALFLAAPLFGDGGTVLARQDSGAFTVTLFASPADWSVLVQRRDTLAPVLDANVSIRVVAGEVAATHAQAQNKLLYAAPVEIPGSGDWKYEVRVNGVVAVTGMFSGGAPAASLLAYWFYFVLPIGFVLLFLLHQRLAVTASRKQKPTNQSPKPVYTVLSSR